MIRSARSDINSYGVIFTCLTIRAVYLGNASTLHASSFIQALTQCPPRTLREYWRVCEQQTPISQKSQYSPYFYFQYSLRPLPVISIMLYF